MKRFAAAVVILFAVTTGTFADASAQVAAGSFAAVPVFGATGLASVVFMGGSVDQLETVTLAVGASGAWVQAADGSFSILIAGGPSRPSASFGDSPHSTDARRSCVPGLVPGSGRVGRRSAS